MLLIRKDTKEKICEVKSNYDVSIREVLNSLGLDDTTENDYMIIEDPTTD